MLTINTLNVQKMKISSMDKRGLSGCINPPTNSNYKNGVKYFQKPFIKGTGKYLSIIRSPGRVYFEEL